MKSTVLQVRSFLGKLKDIAPRTIVLLRQEKTRMFLDLIEFDREDVLDVLFSLTEADYSFGPTDNDWGNGGQVWIFGATVEGYLVYIKLNIVKQKDGNILTCMSFHPTERRMQFPYKKHT